MDEAARVVVAVDANYHCYVSHVSASGAAAAEKQEVAGLKFTNAYAVALEILLARGAVEVDAEVAVDISNEAGAVECAGRCAAETIACSEEAFAIGNEAACKLWFVFSGNKLIGDTKEGRVLGNVVKALIEESVGYEFCHFALLGSDFVMFSRKTLSRKPGEREG